MHEPTRGRGSWSRWTFVLIVAAWAAACVDDTVAPDRRPAPPAAPRVLGFIELSFDGIGTPDMSTSLLAAPSIAGLEALRAERDRLRESGEAFALDLTLPTPEGTIQLGTGTGGIFVHDGIRYLHASYPVRNAQLDGTPYATPRTNLAFFAVSTDQTIQQTAVRRLRLGDGSSANPDLALDVLPTGLVELDDEVESVHPDVLQVLTEAEIGALAPPSGVTSVIPYAFVVRNGTSDDTRMLPASPGPDDFAGEVDFAFRIPAQDQEGDDPQSLVVMMLAVDDSETRLTQSLEEQDLDARLALQQKAEDLSASGVTLLPGGTLPDNSSMQSQRTICSVRTAGTAAAPAAHLVNVDSELESFSPNPYATDGSGSFIPTTTNFEATFTAAVERAGHQNFLVRGLQSGPAFLGEDHEGNGTSTITSPTGDFFPGEEIELTVTNALSCPRPRTVRMRIETGAASGSFDPANAFEVGSHPQSVALGDLNDNGILDLATAESTGVSVLLGNGDGTYQPPQAFSTANAPTDVAIGDLDGNGVLDLVTANVLSNDVSVLLGNGDGTFQPQQTFAAGTEPAFVAIGDLNGNGILDLATTDSSGVSVFLGNGDGTFQPHQTFPAGANLTNVAIGDLDGNGVLDLVIPISTRMTFRSSSATETGPFNPSRPSPPERTRNGSRSVTSIVTESSISLLPMAARVVFRFSSATETGPFNPSRRSPPEPSRHPS